MTASLAEIIRAACLRALQEHGSIIQAAKALDISRFALARRIEKHHIVNRDGVWQ